MNNYPVGVTEIPENEPTFTCDECNGTGKIYPYEDEIVYRKCRDCNGKGEIEIEKD